MALLRAQRVRWVRFRLRRPLNSLKRAIPTRRRVVRSSAAGRVFYDAANPSVVLKMHRVRLISMPTVAAVAVFSAAVAPGASQQAVTIPAECPALLMTHSGGLGTEETGGILVAVWESGYILRARSPKRPSGSQVIGRLERAQVEAVLSLATQSDLWTMRSDGVALDSPTDELELQHGADRLGWAETPGVNATKELATLKTELFKVQIPSPTRTLDKVLGHWSCPAVRWAR